jgi:hypothetical protein
LAAITFLVFFPSYFNHFQKEWDDTWMLLENPYVLNFSWDQFWYHCTHFYCTQYSPVNSLLYIAVYKCFGLHAGAYHIVCLLIHLLNGGLAYRLLQTLFPVLKSSFTNQRINIYAALVVLIFLIHPLQVESVAWISASKVLLYSSFSLGAMLLYVNYIKSSNFYYLLGVITCYFLGFASKEQTIILPFTIVLIDFVFGRFRGLTFSFKSFAEPVVWEKLIFFISALLMWYFSSKNGLDFDSSSSVYPFGQRLIFAAYSLVQYIFHFILPLKLSYLYFYPMEIGDSIPQSYWIYPFLLVSVFWFLWEAYKSKNKMVLFGVLFFVINILLVLNIIPVPRTSIIADRYMYLSVIGLAIVLIYYLDYVLIRLNFRLIKPVFGIYLVVISLLSVNYISKWENSKVLKSEIFEFIKSHKSEQLKDS